jgi:hypothetical protein
VRFNRQIARPLHQRLQLRCFMNRGSDFDSERLVVLAWSFVGASNDEDSTTTSDSSSIIDCECPFASKTVPTASAQSGEDVVHEVLPSKPSAVSSKSQLRQRKSSVAGTPVTLVIVLASFFWVLARALTCSLVMTLQQIDQSPTSDGQECRNDQALHWM